MRFRRKSPNEIPPYDFLCSIRDDETGEHLIISRDGKIETKSHQIEVKFWKIETLFGKNPFQIMLLPMLILVFSYQKRK
ncbi:MAG: hypothetical protein LBR17_08780 [Bacteroidales bacterium]|jgi:hypothetical protein|nr:hypothetical protein [Bacteroidales bacterium]